MKTIKIKIRILNPVPGEARYTSEKRAREHCDNKVAVMTKTGELFFYNNQRVNRLRRDAVTHITESYMTFYRSGVVFWNGDADPTDRHRPGEVVS